MTIKLKLGILGLGGLMISSWADAQVQRSGGEAQKFMQQYQQLAAEKSALQGELAQAKKELDAAKADLTATKKDRDALKSQARNAAASTVSATALAQLTASKESAERTAESSKQRMAELVARFRDTATNLKDVEADRNKLRKDLDERNVAYDKCAENNLQLSELADDVLKRYEHVGMFTKVSATEPFTKISRTRIENLVDEYRTRALELRVKKRAP